MIQVVNALSAQINKQPPAGEQTAAAADFKAILTGQQNSESVQETAASPAQTRIREEKQIAEAAGLEEILYLPEAVKAAVKEWMADGKQPSIEDLAAFLGMSTEQLQINIEKLAEQLGVFTEVATTGDVPGFTSISQKQLEEAGSILAPRTSSQAPFQEAKESAAVPDQAAPVPELEKITTKEVDALLQVIQQLAAVTPKEWIKLEEKAVQTVLQAGKLWQLLGEQADKTTNDMTAQATMKAMMKEIAGKLESLLSSPQANNRTAIIQRAFQNFLHPAAASAKPASDNQPANIIQTATEQADGQPVQQAPAPLAGKEGTAPFQPFFHPLGRMEIMSMSVQTNPRPMNMEQFMEKFSQVLGNSNLVKMPNGTKLLLRLYPEQLGSLRIELLQQNGVMTAKILSSTAAVKELFEQHVNSLKHAFSQHNVTVDKIELSFSQAEPQKFDRQQQQQQSRQPQQQPETGETDEEPTENFQDLLLNMEV